MKPSAKKFTGLALLAVALGACVLFGTYGYASVCGNCGVIRRTTEWQIPFTPIAYWRSESVSQTPFSKALAKQQLVTCKQHNWLFAHGSGNGVGCEIGEGRHLSSAVGSPAVAGFVEAVNRYQGPHEAQRWVKLLLNPDQSLRTYAAIFGSGAPDAGFDSQSAFDLWWRGNREFLAEILKQSNDAGTGRATP